MSNARNRRGMTDVTGIGSALDADLETLRPGTPSPVQPGSASVPARAATPAPRVEPAPDPYRGRGRTEADDPLKNVTITLPASLLTEADMFVLGRKHTASTYNRSTLIQEAITEYLKNHEK